MGLGEPIGNSFLETIKNSYTYQPVGYGYKNIHQTLLGDPSLKMYPYKGAYGLVANTINGGSITTLTWLDSPDPQVLGYYVYRTTALADSFKLLNSTFTPNTNFNDSTAPKGKNIYMVRAVKLQNTNTGKFYNLSPGIIDSITIITPFAVNDIAEQKIKINVYPNPATDYVQIDAMDEKIISLRVLDSNTKLVSFISVNNPSYKLNTNLWSKGTYIIEIETTAGSVTQKVTIQ